MRVTNVDSLSAYFDRLISEKIKWYFFDKDGKEEEALHQEAVIKEIRIKLVELFEESFENHNYKKVVKEWKKYDPTFNKNIQIHYNGEDIEIVNKGIDLDGSLIGEYNNSSKTYKYNEAKIIKK